MKNLYVSAFYRINNQEYSDAILNRIQILSEEIPLYLFCSNEDAEKLASITNLTLHIKELDSFSIYNYILKHSTELPENRNLDKDTVEYMGLMNTKIEFLKLAKQNMEADNYIWIDAGISKIFRNPKETLSLFRLKMLTQHLPTKIIIPGCRWPPTNNLRILTRGIYWHFCGGLFVVPSEFVERFYNLSFMSCRDIIEQTNKAIWEVNVWCYLESLLPILWRDADHNERICEIF